MGPTPSPPPLFSRSRDYQQALNRAAELWGIEPGYWDVWRERHPTPPEVQQAILRALGVPADSLEELDQAVEERLWCEWSRPLPPVLVLSQSAQAKEFTVNVPAELADRDISVEIRWEQAAPQSFRYALAKLESSQAGELRGRTFVRKRVPLPAELPLGYHDLEVAAGAGKRVRASMRLIVGPDRAYLPPWLEQCNRTGGIAISLYGVRSRRNWGCGDFTDLRRIVDWAAEEVKASFVALNPLHAIHNRQPFNTSPYLPNSIFYRNLIYLDVEEIEDFKNSRRALAETASPEFQAALEALRSAELVEYERVSALKIRILRLALDTFLEMEYRRNSTRAGAFRRFMEQEGDLLDRYATYCALDEWMHGRFPDVWVWTQWPAEYQDPESAETRRFREEHAEAVLLHQYIQWQLDLQLAGVQEYARRRGLSIGLYHDLALATDRYGSDLWAHRSYYVSGCRVGAPPDGFSPEGQDWSFPPPNTEHHRETGYQLFAESIRQNIRDGGALRIDHVMRFFHLYWIPEGMNARQGAYVRDFAEDLLRILALESVRHQVIVVGEDLGTVADHVRETLARFGMLSYRLLYFEKNERGEFRPPEEYPELALVSATTHDLPTLAGFWLGRDIEARRAAGLLRDEAVIRKQWEQRGREKQELLDLLWRLNLLPDWVPRSACELPELTGELHNAFVGFLAFTPSKLMLLNQEDLTKETEQQNLPATTSEYANWRRKMRFTVEELCSDPLARDFTTMFRHWLERTGRANRANPSA